MERVYALEVRGILKLLENIAPFATNTLTRDLIGLLRKLQKVGSPDKYKVLAQKKLMQNEVYQDVVKWTESWKTSSPTEQGAMEEDLDIPEEYEEHNGAGTDESDDDDTEDLESDDDSDST